MRLQDKVAIVTGAASGIGRAMAELFTEEGATVIAADLAYVAGGEGPGQPVGLDVTDPAQWSEVVADVVARHGRIDVLVNNAGTVGVYDPLHATELEDWERIIKLNQTGPFLGMKTVIPEMRRVGGGSIVNVSSVWGFVGVAGVAAYTATKGAVRQMSRNAALSYVADGIRVNGLFPGIADTPMVRAQDADLTDEVVAATPMGRLADPREIAAGALFLAGDESSYMTGAELVIDGGYAAQ